MDITSLHKHMVDELIIAAYIMIFYFQFLADKQHW